MIRKIRTLTLATALLGTCAMAADSIDVKVSGDAEITYKTEKSGSETTAYNEAEVNLYFDATNKDGVEFHAGFTAYDGTQGYDSTDAGNVEEPSTNLETSEAYVMVPVSDKIKVTAGLKEDTEFGTEAFWSADAYWRTTVEAAITDGVSVYYEAKKLKEKQQTDGLGDSDANAIGLSGELDGFSFGAEYTSTISDKDTLSEAKTTLLGLYAMGEISGVNVAFEYASEGKDAKGKGFFLSASKEFENGLSAGLAYVTLADGLVGGGDFAAGEILDGNIDSSDTKDTSAFVLPLSYTINDKLTANAVLVAADVLEESATEVDLGFEYALGEQTSISAVYAKLSGDGATALFGEDQTVYSAAITVEF